MAWSGHSVMADGAAGQDNLAATITQIYRAEAISVAEKRRLAGKLNALHAKLCANNIREDAGSTHWGANGRDIDAVEELRVQAGRALGKKKVQISQLKAALRAHGPEGVELASQVSKLSSLRNGAAHPDVSLLSDALDLLGKGGSTSCGSSGTKTEVFSLVDPDESTADPAVGEAIAVLAERAADLEAHGRLYEIIGDLKSRASSLEYGGCSRES